ncbi:hypothetical protein HDV63DRAFT_370995 [Trichoderma sp. SZMC 28014]
MEPPAPSTWHAGIILSAPLRNEEGVASFILAGISATGPGSQHSKTSILQHCTSFIPTRMPPRSSPATWATTPTFRR